jgi:RNA polymerase sigma-70 factor (ECF subfamily)
MNSTRNRNASTQQRRDNSTSDRHVNVNTKPRSIAEEDLVAALQRRDRQAVGTLYDMYAATLYGAIYRIVTVETVAEDVLQETFIKVWLNISSYDPSRGRLFTWLITIARRLALDTVKSRSFRQTSQNHGGDNVVDQIDAEVSQSYNPESIGIATVVDQLNPDHRDLVQLIYFNGYTHAEAAEHLGIPLGTVKTRLRAAVAHLRKILLQIIIWWI